jgi:uncharacterized protein
MYKLSFAIALVFLIMGAIVSLPKIKNSSDPEVRIGNITYKVDVADTATLRRKGLSARMSICDACGMIFAFDEEGHYAIWMKDMNFDLDLVFVDSNLSIVDVYENFKKESYKGLNPERYVNKTKAKYLIELNAGEWSKSGARLGDTVNMLGYMNRI